ncbi:carboxypeptidase-like regulatory domain-containing protein [Aestuariibaculum marinum]|uniref:carboxypeptidase-like regulatory domain-containing protein n=1 Tax=Aestuariibaculum marinum TaxID=2683592 RepID=UPI001660D43D|nr:carboxypeptidase-like regulatory domain-containing protein [Aestuariibaculum marinum]
MYNYLQFKNISTRKSNNTYNIISILFTKQTKQLFWFILFIYSPLSAQNIVSGKIGSESGIILDNANITIRTVNKETVAFGVTNQNGEFSFSVKSGSYILRVSHIGYNTKQIEFEISDKTLSFETITLNEGYTELEEIIMDAEKKSVIQKGDTTHYYVSHFLNGTEQNLKNIIEKLPGLSISENGKITANGKTIDKLLIEGEELFKKQHQLATENISSKMVKNIELIRNYKSFETVNNDKETGVTALNVKIKDTYKNKISGNVESHYGRKDRYKLNIPGFVFKERLKLSIILNSNNLGTSPMGIEDYFDLTEQSQNKTNESQVIISNLNEVPRFLNPNNKVASSQTHFGTISLISTPSEKIKHDFYGIFNYSNQDEINSKQLTFNNTYETFSALENNSINEKNYFGVFKLNSIYKPNNYNTYQFKNQLNIDNTNLIKNVNSLTETQNTQVTESLTPKKIIFDSEISLNKTINSNYFSSNISYHYLRHNLYHELESNVPLFDIDFKNRNFNLKETILKENNKVSTNTSYLINKNKKTFSLYSNTFFSNNKLNSNTNELNEFSNNLNLKCFQSKTGFDLTLKPSKKIRLTAGINYNFAHNYLNKHYSNNLFLGYKSNFKVIFNSNHITELSYNYLNFSPEIDNLISGFIIKDYRSLIANNNISANDIFPYHQIRFSHFIFNPKSLFSYMFNIIYNIKDKALGENIVINQNFSITQSKTTNKDDTFNAFVFIDKTLKEFPLSISSSLSYSWNDKVYFLDDEQANFKQENISGMFKFSSNFKDFIANFNAGIKFSKDNFTNNNTSSRFVLYQPFLNIEGCITKQISWNLESKLSKYTNNKSEQYLRIISPKIRYLSLNSNWEFYISGNDILNLNRPIILDNNSTPTYFEEKRTYILQGYIIFGTKLNF